MALFFFINNFNQADCLTFNDQSIQRCAHSLIKSNALNYNKRRLKEMGHYCLWKEQNKNLTNSQLLQIVIAKQDHFVGPWTKARKSNSLHAYNLLRERYNASLSPSFKKMDQEWIRSEGYKIWKRDKKTEFSNIVELLNKIRRYDTLCRSSSDSPELMYYYNLVRESLNMNPSDAIDWSWINKVYAQFIENGNYLDDYML